MSPLTARDPYIRIHTAMASLRVVPWTLDPWRMCIREVGPC